MDTHRTTDSTSTYYNMQFTVQNFYIQMHIFEYSVFVQARGIPECLFSLILSHSKAAFLQ